MFEISLSCGTFSRTNMQNVQEFPLKHKKSKYDYLHVNLKSIIHQAYKISVMLKKQQKNYTLEASTPANLV